MITQMTFTTVILYHLGVRTAIGIIGENQDPQSMEELCQNYKFDQPDPPFTWDAYLAKRLEVFKERALIRLRKYRDIELKNTDWIEIPTNLNTIENIGELLEYRQKLRDLPNLVTCFEWIFDGAIPRLDMVKMGVPQRPKPIRKPSS